MLEDENSKVKAKAIEVATLMFVDILDKSTASLVADSTIFKVFESYILPAFRKLKIESKMDYYV